MRPRAINVKAVEDYNILIEFDNGELRKFDVKPYLSHKVFEKLKDKNKFNKVKIDGLSISWEDEIEICPDELYNNSCLIENL